MGKTEQVRCDPAQREPSRSGGKLMAASLFLGSLGVYWLTFSPMPAGDGIAWIREIRGGNWAELFGYSYHLLPLPLTAAIYQLLLHCGLPIKVIAVLQATGALAGAAGTLLFFVILKKLGCADWASAAAALAFAFSHSYWRYLDGEIHVLGILLVITAFYLVVVQAPPWLSGLVCGLAILFHVEHFLAAPALALGITLLAPRDWRRILGRLAAFATGLGSIIVVTYLLVRVLVLDTTVLTGGSLLWSRSVSPVGSYISFQPLNLVYAADAQAVALVASAQVIAFYLLGWQTNLSLGQTVQALGTLLLFSGMLALVAATFRYWKQLSKHGRWIVLVALVWLGAYKICFNLWYAPIYDEFHASTLPPLLTLIFAVPLFLPAGTLSVRHRRLLHSLVTMLVGGIFVLNLFGSILPWRAIGEAFAAAGREVERISSPSDLFLTTESTFPLGYFAHRSVSPLIDFAGHSNPQEAANATLQEIETALVARRRVFIYDPVPPDDWVERQQTFFADEMPPGVNIEMPLYKDVMAAIREHFCVVPIVRYVRPEFRSLDLVTAYVYRVQFCGTLPQQEN